MARRLRTKFRLLILGAFVAIVIGLGALGYLSTRFSRYFNDPTLVASRRIERPTIVLSPNIKPSVRARFYQAYYRLFPPRGPFRFHGRPAPMRCSIDGMLNQCQEVSSVQYFVDKELAAGTVMFGPTNTLDGPRWVTAFTNAVQTGDVQWWDSNRKIFRKENPVFVPIGRDAFLVLPKERVKEYAKGWW